MKLTAPSWRRLSVDVCGALYPWDVRKERCIYVYRLRSRHIRDSCWRNIYLSHMPTMPSWVLRCCRWLDRLCSLRPWNNVVCNWCNCLRSVPSWNYISCRRCILL